MKRIVFTARATREIDAAHDWWVAHREKAPTAFTDDTADMLERLAKNPALGKPVPRLGGDVRRVLLARIRYHLYYRVHPDHIEILSLWHTSRGSTPRL